MATTSIACPRNRGTEVIDADHAGVIIDVASSSHPMRCHRERTIDSKIEAGDLGE